jgi:uncharacterized protein
MRYLLLVIPIICLIFSNANAQSVENDLDLLLSPGKSNEHDQTKHRGSYNPFKFIYTITLNVYQKHLSAQLDANCAFEITCSRFSRLMLKDFGLAKGYFLTFDRLGRCNHISTIESHPIRINQAGKIIEQTSHLTIR